MQRRASLVPDLYHVKRTTRLPGGDIHVEVCGTYTDLEAAQAAGLRRLLDEGRSKESFSRYDENEAGGQPEGSGAAPEGWKHGPNVLVHADLSSHSSDDAAATNGNRSSEIHEVAIETTPNSLGVRARRPSTAGARPVGRVDEPLFYVVQKTQTSSSPSKSTSQDQQKGNDTTTSSHHGSSSSATIRSIHLSKQSAIAAARHELLDHDVQKDWYTEYNEVGTIDEEDEGGEEVVVRATGPEGQSFEVTVVHEV